MENALYVGLSKQVAMKRQMNLVANNIANVNTPGYRADKILFEEYVTRAQPTNEPLSMVLDYGQYKDTATGDMQYTGNKLDIALDGPGFMMVETAAGTKYTRAGNFALDNERNLVTPSGNPVLTQGEGRIKVPEGVTDINITTNGEIVTDQGTVGQIGVVEFDNVQTLRPTGDGFYMAGNGQAGQAAENTFVKQGMLEGSNVQAVLEMTDMIEISRQFQSTQRMLQNEHERQKSSIQILTETK